MHNENSRKATLAALTANTIFGFSFLASRIALGHTVPSVLLVIRFGVSLLIMLLLIGIGLGKVSFKNKPLLKIIMLGLCQPVIYFLGETYGIKYTSSSFAGIVIAVIPIVSSVLSAIFLKEKFQRSKLLWILCSIFGVAIISISQGSAGIITVKGILFLLVAVMAASVFSLLSKSSSDQFSAFERTFIMMVMGFVFFLGMASVQFKGDFPGMLINAVSSPYVMLPILYLSVLSSIVAFFCQNYSMAILPIHKATVFANLTTALSVVAGVVVLHEAFSPFHLVGIILIILGIYKTAQPNKQSAASKK